MNIGSFTRSIALIAGAGMFALTLTSADALAGKKKKKKGGDAPEKATAALEIVETGISAFDDVFKPAGEIIGNLNASTQSLNDVNGNIVKAMGLGEDSSVADAIAMMKEKADGKFKVAIKDLKPAVEVADDAPDDVKAAVAAINDGGQAIADAMKSLGEIPNQTKEIIAKAKDLPGQVPAAAKEAGLKPTQIPALGKQLKANVSALKGIPEAAKGTMEAAKSNVDLIQSLAPAPAE